MQLNQLLPKKDKTLLKIISCILGCIMWAYHAPNRIVTKSFTVPICFYNNAPETTLPEVPESVIVHLRGTRAELAALNTQHLALHIDAHTITQHKQIIEVSNKTLLLPNRIQVVYYNPLNTIMTQ